MENERKIIRETNSYYTEKEYEKLTTLGFKWSNKSGDYDNALYQYKNGSKFNIMATKNGFNFEKNIATIFGVIYEYHYKQTLEEVIEKLKTNTIKQNIALNISKLMTFLVCVIVFFIQIFSFLIFNKDKELSYFNALKQSFRIFFINKKSQYLLIIDATFHCWGLIFGIFCFVIGYSLT